MKKLTRLLAALLAVLLCAGCAQSTDDPLVVTEMKPTEPDPVLMERRDAAESYMRSMATVLWRASEDVIYTKDKNVTTEEQRDAYEGDILPIRAGRLYRGIPYSYSGTSAGCFELYLSEPDEKGIHTLSGLDWQSLNGSSTHTARVGNDCSGSIQLAWESVGGSFTPSSTKYMVLINGFLPVGDYKNDPMENIMTKQVCEDNGGEVMFAAYAQLQKADAVVYRGQSAGHTMMVVDVNVVYNSDGTIDGMNSYITVLHQTSSYIKKEAYEYDETLGEDVYKTYGIDDQYTFLELFGGGYLPVTCDALVSTEAGKKTEITDSEAVHSYENILYGTFTSNRIIAYVAITVTDANGQEVTKAVCLNPRQTNRTTFTFDLERFVTEPEELMQGKLDLESLKPGTYHCTHVLTDAHGGEHVMRDFEFTVE